MGIPLALHVLFAVIWVGGMFFAYLCLRPALCHLDEKTRATLWSEVLGRFFFWVRIAAAVLLLSGLYMIDLLGGMQGVGLHVHLMLGLGVVMMLLFLHANFAPFRRLRRAVEGGDWAAAIAQVNQIRVLVAINLCLGLLVVLIAAGGRYMLA